MPANIATILRKIKEKSHMCFFLFLNFIPHFFNLVISRPELGHVDLRDLC